MPNVAEVHLDNPQMSDIVLVLDKMELLIQAVSEINKNGKYSTVPADKELNELHLEQLFSSGATKVVKGFKGKKGNSFDAAVTFDDEFNVTLAFTD